MNNTRRKAIDELIKQVEAIKPLIEAAKDAMEKLKEEAGAIQADISIIRDEEQEYLDNMSENARGGEKAGFAESAISNLDEALSIFDFDSLDDFDADSIVTLLDAAKE